MKKIRVTEIIRDLKCPGHSLDLQKWNLKYWKIQIKLPTIKTNLFIFLNIIWTEDVTRQKIQLEIKSVWIFKFSFTLLLIFSKTLSYQNEPRRLARGFTRKNYHYFFERSRTLIEIYYQHVFIKIQSANQRLLF